MTFVLRASVYTGRSPWYMSLRSTLRQSWVIRNRLGRMTSHFSSNTAGVSLAELPKSNVFTNKLPPDPAFETPASSHNAPRETLGPRLVRGALYTFVRPETTEEPELLGVSPKAMEDLGIKPGEELTPQFKDLVSGNQIYWSEESGGIYPWAQCYGGELAYPRPKKKTMLEFFFFKTNKLKGGNCMMTRDGFDQIFKLTQFQWRLGRTTWRRSKLHPGKDAGKI